MRLFKKTNIDFMGKRKMMYFASMTIIAIGMVSLIVKGIDFGIDFRGGTELVVTFANKPDYGQLREALGTIGFADSEVKAYGSENSVLIRSANQGDLMTITAAIRDGLRAKFADNSIDVRGGAKIGPKIGKELRRDAAYAVTASLFVILAYVAIRYKFSYGMGAVLALFHDVVLTLGVISILDGLIPWLNLEITQEMIAAFLTIVGLSVNDTVVVFDRIRENTKIYRSLSVGEVMNRSLNDTLSRTIITSGTILIVLLVLLFLGGEVTRGFAFTLTVGIITGTYSSIYIASATVLDYSLWKKKERKP